MVVMDVHNRDTTEELATLGVRAQSRCIPIGFGGSQALEGKGIYVSLSVRRATVVARQTEPISCHNRND